MTRAAARPDQTNTCETDLNWRNRFLLELRDLGHRTRSRTMQKLRLLPWAGSRATFLRASRRPIVACTSPLALSSRELHLVKWKTPPFRRGRWRLDDSHVVLASVSAGRIGRAGVGYRLGPDCRHRFEAKDARAILAVTDAGPGVAHLATFATAAAIHQALRGVRAISIDVEALSEASCPSTAVCACCVGVSVETATVATKRNLRMIIAAFGGRSNGPTQPIKIA